MWREGSWLFVLSNHTTVYSVEITSAYKLDIIEESKGVISEIRFAAKTEI